jgi:tetratricopeptide (TPR) repeat protein
LTLSVAAEQETDEAEALAAARKGAGLWSRGTWSDRAERLHDGWVIDRISRSMQLVTEAAFAEALELVERALGLEPGNREGLLVKARALIGLERPSEAEKVLASLGADPEAVFLAATIAEQREDWVTAMDLYSALPEGFPQRDDRLSETQLKWRLSHQPRHVKEALHSTEITRSELAILMTALAPELDGLQGEPVPVLSDIVDAAGRREILTVVRVGLLDVDRLEHRFHPDRIVSEAEVRAALERLATLLQRRTPEWCEQLESSSECDMIAAPISGAEVATVILNRTEEVGP